MKYPILFFLLCCSVALGQTTPIRNGELQTHLDVNGYNLLDVRAFKTIDSADTTTPAIHFLPLGTPTGVKHGFKWGTGGVQMYQTAEGELRIVGNITVSGTLQTSSGGSYAKLGSTNAFTGTNTFAGSTTFALAPTFTLGFTLPAGAARTQARSQLELRPNIDIQSYDAELSELAAIAAVTGDVPYYTGGAWTALNVSALVGDGTITAAKLATSSVTTAKILDGTILPVDLADLTVTTAKIDDLGVTTAKLAAAGVTTAKLADTAVTFAKVQNMAASTILGRKSGSGSGVPEGLTLDSNFTVSSGGVLTFVGAVVTAGDKGDITVGVDVTAWTLNNSAVTAGKIATGAVTTGKLADDAVDGSKLADLAVTTAHLAATSVTAAKIATNTITATQVATGAIEADEIGTGAVTEAKLGAAAVTTAKIADGNVTTAKYAAGSVDTTALGALAVTTAKIDDLGVTTGKLAAGAVTTAKIADSAVTTVKIADSNVTTAKIADGAVTTAKLGAGSISSANGGLGIDTSATTANSIPIMSAVVGTWETMVLEAYMRTFLDAATVGAAQTAIGLGTGDGVVFDSLTLTDPLLLAYGGTGLPGAAPALNDNDVFFFDVANPTRFSATPGTAFGLGWLNTADATAARLALVLGTTDDVLFDNIDGTDINATGTSPYRISGSLVLHTTGTASVFAGVGAGNNTNTGADNVAIGYNALTVLTSGQSNTVIGSNAGDSLTGGTYPTAGANTLIGTSAGAGLTTGGHNTLIGYAAAGSLVSATNNVVIGSQSATNATGGSNIVIGTSIGTNLTSGTGNIYIGINPASNESSVTRIGNIYATNVTSAAVYIDSAGLLGRITSSRRFKEDIHDMTTSSLPILQLRPVTFRYKKAQENGQKPIQFGLIAEEVEEVLPQLVTRDAAGVPDGVKYHDLPVLLLNEFQIEHQIVTRHVIELRALRARVADLETRLQRLEALVK